MPKGIFLKTYVEDLRVKSMVWRLYSERGYLKMEKTKKIYKSEFKEKWPFMCSSVKIKLIDYNFCLVKINGVNYCLNGLARDNFPKLKNIFDLDVVIKGKSIGPIIDAALNL